MSWFLIALAGPFLSAITNHTDKYLISKYVTNGAVGALIIFSAIFSIVAIPIVLLIDPSVLSASLANEIILAVNGVVVIIAVLFYLYALHEDEASYAVPFFQTIPIFGFIIGYMILGETITVSQGVASVLVILGALVLSVDIGEKLAFKKKVVILMVLSSILYAINGVVFKMIAVEEGFWLSTFWSLVGKLVLGIAFLLFVPVYRNQFIEMFRENRTAVLGLNSMNETIYMIGEILTLYAMLLAPVALVFMVGSFQPLFVLIIGVLLTMFFPHLGRESISRVNISQKVIGIGLMLLGAYFVGL